MKHHDLHFTVNVIKKLPYFDIINHIIFLSQFIFCLIHTFRLALFYGIICLETHVCLTELL